MPKNLQHHMIVRQAHLNQYGNLFGGRVLAVIDELAFITCSRTWPGRNFVTRAVQNAEFTAPARLGDILEFNFGIERIGRTSVHVRVEMIVRDSRSGKATKSFDGLVIMVCVDAAGQPEPVPPVNTT
ncbi:MAG TPA: hotdog domain-containing protein [Planctomycetota bacterium]|nr:hotdog domain-containing protein [Planctomycetota bacterium]